MPCETEGAMPLFLAYPTSLEVLRLFRAGFADNGVPVDTEARSPFPGSPSLFEHIPSNETPHDGDVECLLRASHPLWDEALAKPLHLYAGSQKCRGQSRLKRIVTCTTKFPEGAFVIWTITCGPQIQSFASLRQEDTSRFMSMHCLGWNCAGAM